MHGIGGASENWSSQLYELSNNYRVIAWDMPGYGGSANLKEEKPDSASYAEVVIALLDYLSIKQCHIVGQSVSALIAARIASDYPERVLTITLSHPLTGFGGLSAKDRDAQRAARLDLFSFSHDFFDWFGKPIGFSIRIGILASEIIRACSR